MTLASPHGRQTEGTQQGGVTQGDTESWPWQGGLRAAWHPPHSAPDGILCCPCTDLTAPPWQGVPFAVPIPAVSPWWLQPCDTGTSAGRNCPHSCHHSSYPGILGNFVLFVLSHYQKLLRGFFKPLPSRAPAGLGSPLCSCSNLWAQHILNFSWNGAGGCQPPISLGGRAGRSQADLTKC